MLSFQFMAVRRHRVSERCEEGRLATQEDYDVVLPDQRFDLKNETQCCGWAEGRTETFVAFVAAAANK